LAFETEDRSVGKGAVLLGGKGSLDKAAGESPEARPPRGKISMPIIPYLMSKEAESFRGVVGKIL